MYTTQSSNGSFDMMGFFSLGFFFLLMLALFSDRSPTFVSDMSNHPQLPTAFENSVKGLPSQELSPTQIPIITPIPVIVEGQNLYNDSLASSSLTYPIEVQEAKIQVQTISPELSLGGDPTAIIAPYEDFILTQGIHGYSYGQMAIDIAAGNGAIIHSPIFGTVTKLYVDQYSNTIIVIENEIYQVTLYHGLYSVNIGDLLLIGQPIGTESNQGYTLDAYGRLCAGRDCGYHTHLNIFDKRIGINVNPLDLLGI